MKHVAQCLAQSGCHGIVSLSWDLACPRTLPLTGSIPLRAGSWSGFGILAGPGYFPDCSSWAAPLPIVPHLHPTITPPECEPVSHCIPGGREMPEPPASQVQCSACAERVGANTGRTKEERRRRKSGPSDLRCFRPMTLGLPVRRLRRKSEAAQ